MHPEHRESESELVEQFIDRLAHDPDAPVPDGLDVQFAQFVRAVVRAKAPPTTEAALPARVWQKALSAAQSEKEHPAQQPGTSKREDTLFLQTAPIEERRFPRLPARTASYLTMLAATIILVLLSAALIGYFTGRKNQPGSTPPIAAAGQTPTLAPTAVPTIAPTFTLMSTAVQLSATGSPANLTIGNTIAGKLTAETPQAAYQVEIPHDGILDLVGVSQDFTIVLNFIPIQKPVATESGGGDSGGGGGGSGGGGGGGGMSGGNGGGPAVGNLARNEMFVRVQAETEGIVTVSSQSGQETGAFSLGVYLTDPIPLSFDKPVESDIVETWQASAFTFAGSPGDILDIRVTSDGKIDLMAQLIEVNSLTGFPTFGIQGLWTLCNTEPFVFCGDDDSGQGSDPEIHNFLIRRQAAYIVLIRPVIPLLTGHFRIEVNRHQPVSLDSGGQPLRLTWKDKARVAAFQGKAGQSRTLKIGLMSGSNKIPIRTTVMQAGIKLADVTLASAAAGTPAGEVSQPITVPADGPVVIFVEYAHQPQPGIYSDVQLSLVP